MKFSQFDAYSRYLKAVAVIIALLTYWRFRDLNISAVYGYVAQGDVIHSAFYRTATSARSIVWDFFGLINRFISPHSLLVLRAAGLLFVVLDLFLLSRLLDYLLGQKFWGFLAVFLAALSPFAVVAGVAGSPAGVAVALVLLFLMALYKNRYAYASILSAVCFAANLPSMIMFLITLLDMLQNSQERETLLRKILFSSALFLGVVGVEFGYSIYSGGPGILSLLVGDRDLTWTVLGSLPLFIANSLNLAGIIYLIVKRRYDVYRTHFHTLMLWISSLAICVAQPSTLNMLVALVLSVTLMIFFLQGFTSIWNLKFAAPETFVFLFVTMFLFCDLYANNVFIKDSVLEDSVQQSDAFAEMVRIPEVSDRQLRLVSNFATSELAVKLGRRIYAVDEGMLAMGDLNNSSIPTVFIARRSAKADRLTAGCKILLSTSYNEEGNTYYIQVAECGGQNE